MCINLWERLSLLREYFKWEDKTVWKRSMGILRHGRARKTAKEDNRSNRRTGDVWRYKLLNIPERIYNINTMNYQLDLEMIQFLVTGKSEFLSIVWSLWGSKYIEHWKYSQDVWFWRENKKQGNRGSDVKGLWAEPVGVFCPTCRG